MMTVEKATEIIATLQPPTNAREEWAGELLLSGCTTDLEQKISHDESWALLESIDTFQKLVSADRNLAQSYLSSLSKIINSIEN